MLQKRTSTLGVEPAPTCCRSSPTNSAQDLGLPRRMLEQEDLPWGCSKEQPPLTGWKHPLRMGYSASPCFSRWRCGAEAGRGGGWAPQSRRVSSHLKDCRIPSNHHPTAQLPLGAPIKDSR